MERKHYDYPEILYCDHCRDDVESVVVDRVEPMIKDGKEIEVPYKLAVCKNCGAMLCDRDLDEVILAMAREDGMYGGGSDGQ